MSSRRNSQRRTVTAKKPSYKETTGDDEDGDDVEAKLSKYFEDGYSSGSDFETEMKKKGGNKRESTSESEEDPSSEAESEQAEDEEEEEGRVGRKKNGGKKTPTTNSAKSTKAKTPSEVPMPKVSPAAKLARLRRESLGKNPTSNLASMKNSQVEYRAGSFGQFRANVGHKPDLNLSESSSDDEHSDPKPEPKPDVSVKPTVAIEKKKVLVNTKVESSSEDDGEIASKLVNLVTSFSQATESMKQSASQHVAFKSQNLDRRKSLSDSDSENEADQPVKLPPARTAHQAKSAEIKKEELDDEDDDMASRLEDLVKAHRQDPVATKKPETPKSSKKSSRSKKHSKKSTTDDHKSIKDLLAMGEGLESQSEDESDDEDEASQAIPGSGIEISVEVPGHVKKKKKGFDVEAYLKREMAKAQREVQLSVHQSHIVCLVAHLRHINCYLSPCPRVAHPSAAVTLGVALSVVPPVHASVPEKLNLVTLSAFVSWFRESFPIASGSKQLMSQSEKQFPHPLDAWIQRCFENYFCESRDQLLLAFVAATRSVGWPTRIVLNFETASMKPPKTAGNDSNSNEDSESNKDEKAKKDSKSKSENEKDKKKNEKTAERKEKYKKALSDADKLKDKEREKSKDRSSTKRKSSETVELKNKRAKTEEKEKNDKRNEGKELNQSRNLKDKKSGKIEDSKRTSKSGDKSRQKYSDSEISPSKRAKTDKMEDRKTNRSSSKSKPSQDFESGVSSKNNRRSSGPSSKTSTKVDAEVSKSVKKIQQRDLSSRAIQEALKRKSGAMRDRDGSASESDSEPNPSSKEGKSSSSQQAVASKNETLSKRKSNIKKKNEDSDFEPDPKPKKSGSSKTRKKSLSNSDSDFDAEPKRLTKKSVSDELPQKKITKAAAKVPAKTVQYWVEVLTPTHGWITIDIIHGRVNCVSEMESLCKKPIIYILAVNDDGTVKDLTKKYVSPSTYLTQTRKLRVSQEWLDQVMDPFKPKLTPEEKLENEKIEKHLLTAPMPTTVSGFKSHPLFVLKRHLLKFEAIYPETAPTLGFIRGEAVYARECVHTLHCRVTWLKDGRVVRIGEEPYKVVKARPKWDRMNGTVIKDQPLEVFGKWQTEIYVPPPAVDGKVPRNEYGNVELFKPWMLPKGTVHIPIVGLNRVAKKLDIDCAPAMVGWEFSGGGCHPVFDGFVVCQELAETLMDAWNKDQEEKLKKEAEKKEKRALDNWKKLIKGMLMHQKIRNKYLGEKK